jgi:hypothetical protein
VDQGGEDGENLLIQIVQLGEDRDDFPLVVFDIGARADGYSGDHFLVGRIEVGGRGDRIIGRTEDIVASVPLVCIFFSEKFLQRHL